MSSVSDFSSPEPQSRHTDEKKRKRKIEHDAPEIEVDVDLPEPPSKKAKRKEKKSQVKSNRKIVTKEEKSDDTSNVDVQPRAKDVEGKVITSKSEPVSESRRSDHGIWIGNLAFSTKKSDLLAFLRDKGQIAESEVTRIHMPAPPPDKNDSRAIKPQNKGFAYVDFTSAEVLHRAIALSEQLLTGRKVLIKNAKSFEGRPEKPKGDAASQNGLSARVKEPTRRVFVGNLGFDVARDDLQEHFEQAGGVDDIHMATFEDSGKCKGFAWVTFTSIEAAKAAVEGFIWKTPDPNSIVDPKDDQSSSGDSSSEDEAGKKKKKTPKRKAHKPRKWFINRLRGRPLRCEFAEDAQTRYKKRFGPSKSEHADSRQLDRRAPAAADDLPIQEVDGQDDTLEGLAGQAAAANGIKKTKVQKRSKDERQEDRRKRHESKMHEASAGPVGRVNGTALVGTGKKVVFD